MRGFIARLALFLTSCTNDQVFTLSPPNVDGAKSMVIAIHNNNGIERAIAVSLDEAVLPIKIDIEHADRVTALLYQDTLAEQELHAGDLQPVAVGPTRPVPEGDAAFVLELPDGRAWVSSNIRSIDFTIATRDPCPRFQPHNVFLETAMGRPQSALKLDEQTALVFLDNGEWWRVDRSSAVFLRAEPRVYAGFKADDDTLWLVTGLGELWSGDLASGFTATATIPLIIESAAIDGSRGDAPFELFLMINDNTFFRFDENRRLHLIDDFHEDGSAAVDVEWLGPNHAIAIGSRQRGIVRTFEGHTAEESFQNVFDIETPSSLGHDPKLGSFVGSERGFLFQRKEDDLEWTQIGGVGAITFGAMIQEIQRRGEGVIMGVGDGAISVYLEGFGVCENQDFTGKTLRKLLIMGDEVLIVPRIPQVESLPPSVIWLSESP